MTIDSLLLIQKNHEWSYEDRRTCQEILDHVWLGPHTCGKDEDMLKAINVTDIVLVKASKNLVEENALKPHFEWINYHPMYMNDTNIESSISQFECISSLVHQVQNRSGTVLILGAAGMNRSASLLAAVLIKTCMMSLESSIEYLCLRRRCISISENLKRQLIEFETLCLAQNGVSEYPANRSGKRRQEYEISF